MRGIRKRMKGKEVELEFKYIFLVDKTHRKVEVVMLDSLTEEQYQISGPSIQVIVECQHLNSQHK